MRSLAFALLSAAIVAPPSACGPSSGTQAPWTNSDGGVSTAPPGSGADSAGASTADSGGGGPSIDTGGTLPGDASTGPAAYDAGAAPGDGGTSSARGGDGGSGAADGGAGPYKGVANAPCADLGALGASWYYNWTTKSGGCPQAEFVPMIWGHASNPTEQTAAGITSEINGLVSAGYRTVLGFNEPDNSGQSNLSPTTAISLWPSFHNPALRVGSPATQGNAAGLSWFASGAAPAAFMPQVNADTSGTLHVDFIAMHWYGWNAGSCDANAGNLESFITKIEAIPGNRPIWITEFGCLNTSNPTAAVVQAFYSGALVMFAKHPRIERYAWFPWATNDELVTNGALTPLGTVFAAAPAHK